MGLKLKIVPQTSDIGGVLNLDGSSAVQDFTGVNLQSNKTIKWKMWLDDNQYTGGLPVPIIKMGNNSGDHFVFTFSSNNIIRIYCAGSFVTDAAFTTGNISSYYNQVLNCEVKKNTQKVEHFMINDVSIPGTYSTTGYSIANIVNIGGETDFYTTGGAIWDVEIIDDSGPTTTHNWIGYPAGNTDVAWEDQVGAIDLAVVTEGFWEATTRDIQGGETVTGSVLSIVPGVETYTGVADFNNTDVTIVVTGSGSDDFRRGSNFKWKMWLDNDSGYSNDLFNFESSTGNPTGHLKSWLLDSSLYLSIVGIVYNEYDITGLDGQILDCELTGGFGSYPQELKINNEVQTGYNVIPTISTRGGVYIGSCTLSVWGQNLDYLDNGTVWDVQTESSLGVPTHAWTGYPAGNTLGAWVDTVGDLDATNIAVLGTRTIEGVDPGSGPVTGSILLIVL